MKHMQIRISDELNNKLELYLKIEGLSKQQFLSDTIEAAIKNNEELNVKQVDNDLISIVEKMNLLLENQLVINNILDKIMGEQNEK